MLKKVNYIIYNHRKTDPKKKVTYPPNPRKKYKLKDDKVRTV